MIYSEFIQMALHELNIPKNRFASEMGISATTLYRILNNETLLPSSHILSKLSALGIDISMLDYNEIYYNYLSEHYGNEYQWIEDISDGYVTLKHKDCGNISKVSLDSIANHDLLCVHCWCLKHETKDYSYYPNNEGEIVVRHLDCGLTTTTTFDALKSGSYTCPFCYPSATNLQGYFDGDVDHYKFKFLRDEYDIDTDEFYDGYELEDYSGAEEVLRLPTSLNGYPIVSIGSSAFSYNRTLKTIIVPEGYRYIGSGAFSSCRKLETLELPNSITKLEEHFCEYCHSLKRVVLPQKTKIIPRYAFVGCECLHDVGLDRPNCIEEIFVSAFEGCESLTSLSLPNVSEIGWDAFKNCIGLSSVYLPTDKRVSLFKTSFENAPFIKNLSICAENVTAFIENNMDLRESLQFLKIGGNRIPDSCFEKYKKLETLIICEGLTEISENAFSCCENLKDVSLPDSIQSMGDCCFFNTAWQKDLREGMHIFGHVLYMIKGENIPKRIMIPEGIIEIASSAFSQSDIESVSFPFSLLRIGKDAFWGCTNLSQIYWNNSLLEIHDTAFHHCEKLVEIHIPDSVRFIGEYAFENTGLQKCVLGRGIKELSSGVFEGCKNLTTVVLPKLLNKIEWCAFSKCTSLKEISIPPYVEELVGSCFEGCMNLSKINFEQETASLQNLRIVGYNCFEDCESLEEITIPNSVETIDELCFYGCSNLKRITIGNNVTFIGGGAFMDCHQLIEIIIPQSVTSIDSGAFEECHNLRIFCEHTTVPETWDTEWCCEECDRDEDFVDVRQNVYWYSHSKPTNTGNYWHYVNTKPIVW